ncbi:MAG: hypothetical protein KME64_09495 [Scytonematopsis contorta HA4267-MV1]|jgi:hypothetical protein|nr:hypothetical protein [Scytonematopsis contorta HA4267-MV1]
MKLTTFIKSSSLATIFIGLGASAASAQLVIESTGTISGTIQLPSFNPNFNRDITRIDTASDGTYSRNIGTRQNPNFVSVYRSNYVKVQTRSDGSLHYFVDFKGIPVISFDGGITSPALTGGELTPYNYQGRLPGVKYQAVVQDELALGRAFYTGIVTDPKTGDQYQGTFTLRGQGPRYSDRNGGESPTVFDFKSDQPGSPTVTSYRMTNTPLVRLRITVPQNATRITPNPTPPTTTPNPTPPTTTPNPTPPTTTPNPTPNPIPPTIPAPISDTPQPITDTPSPISDSPNMEFSSGKTFGLNPVVARQSQNQDVPQCRERDNVQCRNISNNRKQTVGPRSRVLLR